jgi:acetyl-CoA decarbonylase/synthase complex subunit gamma
VARIATEISFRDRLGAWKVRWGIGRNTYIVPPGLYAVGIPAATDPVVVTANYKMSFDIVRRTLKGRNCWILVLETFGINVWCAAGKGTFGTGELVRRVASSGLARVVSHRRLLLPILGGAGISAPEASRRSGFTIQYAAIRAADLPEFFDNGMTTTPDMRELTFTFFERLVLIPVELVQALKPASIAGLLSFAAFTTAGGIAAGISALSALLGALLAGLVATPLLLPWLPGRSFALKGAVLGTAWSTVWCLLNGRNPWSMPATLAAFMALPAISAFYALTFTGCTPFTSRSGVKKELRFVIPAIGCSLVTSLFVLLASILW